MSVAKVIEVIAEGDTIEGAISSAVSEASKTVNNIKNVYTEGIQAVVEGKKVKKYRVNCKVTFVVNG